MASLHELTEPIYHGTLKNLQGNILRGHGRDMSVHIFLRFKTGMEYIRYHQERPHQGKGNVMLVPDATYSQSHDDPIYC